MSKSVGVFVHLPSLLTLLMLGTAIAQQAMAEGAATDTAACRLALYSEFQASSAAMREVRGVLLAEHREAQVGAFQKSKRWQELDAKVRGALEKLRKDRDNQTLNSELQKLFKEKHALEDKLRPKKSMREIADQIREANGKIDRQLSRILDKHKDCPADRREILRKADLAPSEMTAHETPGSGGK